MSFLQTSALRNTLPMKTETETSDQSVLDRMRIEGAVSISDLVEYLGVTATAVRQRLNRLMGQGLIERTAEKQSRGRPSHAYSLTSKGVREAGTNYPDLAVILWQEIIQIKDKEIRKQTLSNITSRLTDLYRSQITGDSLTERMQSVASLMRDRNIPFQVDETGQLPVLNVLACPYPDLMDTERSICSVEQGVFSELFGEAVAMEECHLDGDGYCAFKGESKTAACDFTTENLVTRNHTTDHEPPTTATPRQTSKKLHFST